MISRNVGMAVGRKPDIIDGKLKSSFLLALPYIAEYLYEGGRRWLRMRPRKRARAVA